MGSYKELLKIFYTIRDSRFLIDTAAGPMYRRRIPWQYPQDKCWARTGMTDIYAEEQGLVRPVPIWVFGELVAHSNYSRNKDEMVYWAWHVAPMLAVNNINYVLDPALNPAAPLEVNAWYKAMHDAKLTAVVCKTFTYYPDDSCNNPIPYARDEKIKTDISYALDAERENIDLLFMGETPPWSWSPPRTFGTP